MSKDKSIRTIGRVPYEYFCPKCLQLRLSFTGGSSCGNCGYGAIIKGDINSLDKEALKLRYSKSS